MRPRGLLALAACVFAAALARPGWSLHQHERQHPQHQQHQQHSDADAAGAALRGLWPTPFSAACAGGPIPIAVNLSFGLSGSPTSRALPPVLAAAWARYRPLIVTSSPRPPVPASPPPSLTHTCTHTPVMGWGYSTQHQFRVGNRACTTLRRCTHTLRHCTHGWATRAEPMHTP